MRLFGPLRGKGADALDGDKVGLFVHGVENAVRAHAEAVVAGRLARAGAGWLGIRIQGVEGPVDGPQGFGVKRSKVCVAFALISTW